MDSALLKRTKEKLTHDLTSEEQEALKQCSQTVTRHTRIGAILGGSLSVYGMYRRKLWPLSKYWGRGLFFGVGGILVGMQLGLLTSSIKSVKIVQALPNPDHVLRILREVQVEMQDARRRPFAGQREWTQKGEEGASIPGESESRGGQMSGQESMIKSEDDSNPSSQWSRAPDDAAKSVNDVIYNGPGPLNTQQQQQQQQQPQNIWQQIRKENGTQPETAWDRLRKTGSADPPLKMDEDDALFSVTSSSDSNDVPAQSSYRDPKLQAKDKDQEEFDRLLDRERQGEAEDASRRRNKFGDYN